MKSKALKRAYAALLSIMLIIELLPTAVFAANTATVKINGQEMQDGVPVQCGEGTATLDVSNGTLTLNDATIAQTGEDSVLRVDNGDLKIILVGENTITSTTKRPFYAGTANITIQGAKEDSLIIETESEGVQIDGGNLTVDGCNINITSTDWGGMLCYQNYSSGYGGILTIQNGANITIDSHYLSIAGDNGVIVTDSTVKAISKGFYSDNGDGSNAIYSMNGDISIDNSTVTATATSEKAYQTIYAFGDINVTNKSNIEITSGSMEGLYTESNMTVTDSTVTSKGTIYSEKTLSLTNSELTALSDPSYWAIVAKNLEIVGSELTAKGGVKLYDWGSGDDISLSITPASGKLAEFKVDINNWDGSAAEHFNKGRKSPYDTVVELTADEMNGLDGYFYVHIGEHIHTGNIDWIQTPETHSGVYECCGITAVEEETHEWRDGVCSECGYACRHAGNEAICSICGAPNPDYVPPAPVYIYYDITASAGEGGTITPDGTNKVLRGTDRTFTVTADSDYVISDVLVDGKSVGAVTSYTFETVREDHSIEAIFTLSEEAQEAIRNEKLKEGVRNTTIRLRSTLGDGFIRLDWEKSAGYKVDYYEVYKSTKRYSGFGTEPYFETKQGGLTGWYKNTKELKKGVRYYYKVRGAREIAGETVYTNWSTKAWRLVK